MICVRMGPPESDTVFRIFSVLFRTLLFSLNGISTDRYEMSDRIDTVSARARLKCRREPYWHKINQGSFLGFRKMTDDVNGVWQVRYREASGTYVTRTLSKFEKSIQSERFDKAMNAARDWISHLKMGGATEPLTVMEACDAYVAKIRALKGDKPADDLEYRYRRWVEPDPIQKLEITKLTRDIMTRFRSRLVFHSEEADQACFPKYLQVDGPVSIRAPIAACIKGTASRSGRHGAGLRVSKRKRMLRQPVWMLQGSRDRFEPRC